MANYYNPAGRILAIFERLGPKNNHQMPRTEIANAFQVADDWAAILVAVNDLRMEYQTLVDEIDQFKENAHKYELYRQNLPEIEKSVNSMTLSIQTNNGTFQILPTAQVALRFIAADLPQDESAEASDLHRIRQLVDELQNEIRGSAEFTKAVREWLLDLVRVIRDSLDRFAIRGSRGMRRQISILVGELMQSYEMAVQVKEQSPSVWDRLFKAIDLMQKLGSLAEKCRPAVTFVMKALPFLRNLGLPAPGEESSPPTSASR